MFRKRVFDPREVLRVVAELELAIVVLESQVWRLALLGPVSAGIVVAEVATMIIRLRRLQVASLAGLANWLATESSLSTRLNELLRDSLVSVAGTVVGAIARMVLPAQNGRAELQKLWATTSSGAQRLTGVLDRLSSTAARSSSVRIEQGWLNGQRNFVIYLPGTQVWVPTQQANPFSLSSDLRLYSGLPSAAQAGVSQLLHSQGVGERAGDKVLFVAHSQGAMVAARLANELPPGSVRGLITVGGPIAGIELPAKLSAINLTHTQDQVPKLALVAPRNGVAVVNAMVPAAPGADPHGLQSYRATAERLEGTGDYAKLRRITENLLETTAGRNVRVTQWQITAPAG